MNCRHQMNLRLWLGFRGSSLRSKLVIQWAALNFYVLWTFQIPCWPQHQLQWRHAWLQTPMRCMRALISTSRALRSQSSCSCLALSGEKYFLVSSLWEVVLARPCCEKWQQRACPLFWCSFHPCLPWHLHPSHSPFRCHFHPCLHSSFPFWHFFHPCLRYHPPPLPHETNKFCYTAYLAARSQNLLATVLMDGDVFFYENASKRVYFWSAPEV